MDRDSIKWLVAGLAGALLTMALFIGGGLTIYFNLQDRIAVNAVQAQSEEQESEAKEEAERAKAAAESAALAERLGLNNLYTPVYLISSTRYKLYYQKDFKQVEQELAAALANTGTPFDRYRYSTMIESIGQAYDSETLADLLKTVDEWAQASPESYLPLLARGKLNKNLAWEYRGSGYAGEVSRTNMKKFNQLNEDAIADLKKAQELNPNDPEIPAALAEAAAPIEGLDSLRMYYDQTLALDPNHVNVRGTMATYLLPQWYGSWGQFDRYMEEIDEASKVFPLIYTVRRSHSTFLELRGDQYKGIWNSQETYRQALAAYKAQLEQNPTELTLMASAAYFAVKTGELATAVGYFDRIGNQFPCVDEFPSLYNYHFWRLYAMVEYSDDPGIIGTPREKELLDAARALEPEHATTNGFYLAYLARTKDDTQTQAYWDSLNGGFYKTGELGSPPDYERLRAMALAARSDDYGVQGTDQEQPMLDEAMALAPENAYVRLVQAEHFITAKNYAMARTHLERARQIDPNYQPALHTMGWLNYHQKRYDEAIACANEFLASAPTPYQTLNADDAKDIIAASEKKKAKAAAS